MRHDLWTDPDSTPGGLCWDEDMPGEEEPGAGGSGEGDSGADGGGQTGEGAGSGAGAGAGAGADGADAGKAEAERLAALKAELADLETKAAARKAEEQEAQRKARLDSGDLLGLYEESLTEKATLAERLAAAEERLQQFEAREAIRIQGVTAANEAVIAALHDDVKALVPDGLDPDALAERLPRLQAISERLAARPAGGRAGTGTKVDEPIPDEAIKLAEELGETADADFVENIYRPYLARKASRAKPAHLRMVGTDAG